MILPNSEQMRQIDRCAIDQFCIPGIVLMENAGLGTVLLLERLLGPLQADFIPIFIGPGNNGGDGLVIARHLHQRNCIPLLVFLVDPDRLKGDSGINMQIVDRLDLAKVICTGSELIPEVAAALHQFEEAHGAPAAVIDAIFGTGLERPVEGHFLEAIELINELGSLRKTPVIAVDTPSGLGSDRGDILGTCVKADHTATYGFAKVGQMMAGSADFTGKLHVIDIGIPRAVSRHVPVATASIDCSYGRTCAQKLSRTANSHKGTFGHLLVVGGSAGKTGAAVLAARGAIRSGCGLVSLCAPAALNTIYETALAEAMTVVLDSEYIISNQDKETIKQQLNGKNCVVLGPGLGQDPATAELVVDLYHEITLPMVVDADALNILARCKDLLETPAGPRVLTPHPGEMARMTGQTAAEIQADRLTSLAECFKQFQTSRAELIILLKGAASLVSDNRTVWLNTTGNPSMAVGGMGDVLSGLIGSLICQGLSCFEAACFAAFWHGFSGDRLNDIIGAGFTASELADDLSLALKDIMGE